MNMLQFFLAFFAGGIVGCTLLLIASLKYAKIINSRSESEPVEQDEQPESATTYRIEKVGEYIHLYKIGTQEFCCKAKTPEEIAKVFYEQTKIPFASAAGFIDGEMHIWFLSRGRLEY